MRDVLTATRRNEWVRFRRAVFLICFFAVAIAAQTPTPAPNAPVEALADKILAAESDAARTILLSENQTLTNGDLRKTLIARGDDLRGKSKLDDALVAYKWAQTVGEKIADADGIAEAQSRQGSIYRYKGEYDRAMQLLEPALKQFQASNNNAGIGMVLNNIGAVSYFRGDYNEAEKHWRAGLAAREKVGVQKEINQSLNNLGALYSATGRIDDALDIFKRLIESSRELKDDFQLAAAINNVGDIYSERGDYKRAMEYLLEALSVDERRGDKLDTSLVLNNIGQVYLSQGNYETAALYYDRARKLREEVGDRQGLAVTLMHLGMVRAAAGEYAAALDLVKQSYDLRERIGDKRGQAIALNNLGRIELNAGHTGAALDYFQRSLAQYETSQYKDGVSQTLNNIARAQLILGDAAQASENVSRAIALARETGAQETLWQGLSILGEAQRALGQPEAAEKTLRESVSTIEAVRSQVTGDALDRQQFFQNKIAPYYALVEQLARAGKTFEALKFAERAKGRVLLDILRTGQNAGGKNLTDKEKQDEKNLQSAVFVLENDLRRAAAKANANRSALAETQTKLDNARAALDSFTNALYAAHPELKIERGLSETINTDLLKQLLPDEKTALVEYVAMEKRTFIFTVSRGAGAPKIEVATVEIGRENLNKTVAAFRQKLAARDLRFSEEAKKLYNLLLAPVAKEIGGKTKIVLAPDAALWELPFQALIDASNKYLVESAAVSYAPSLSVLSEIKRKRIDGGSAKIDGANLVAFGNPARHTSIRTDGTTASRPVSMSSEFADLPEAERQVKALSALYGTSRSQIFTGAGATETEFKRAAASYKILHLATHGVLDDASPLYSYVLLSQRDEKSGEDGKLEAWELMRMNLSANLVVLSACETGRGRVSEGEGLIGLSWAFFVAGSPTTVASLWKVESAATTELMLGFYRLMQNSRVSKSEALRQSSLALLKNPKYAHPFYWAGFVVVGDGGE